MDYINNQNPIITPSYAEVRAYVHPIRNISNVGSLNNECLNETTLTFDFNCLDFGGYLFRTNGTPVTGTATTSSGTQAGTLLSGASGTIQPQNNNFGFMPREGELIYQPHWNLIADSKFNQIEIRELQPDLTLRLNSLLQKV